MLENSTQHAICKSFIFIIIIIVIISWAHKDKQQFQQEIKSTFTSAGVCEMSL